MNMQLADSGTSAGDNILGAVILITGLVLYFLPVIIAVTGRQRNAGSVAVVDIFLGWTGIGWVVALAMAVSGVTNPKPPESPASGPPMASLPPASPWYPPPWPPPQPSQRA